MEQYIVFDLFKAFDHIESSHESDFFSLRKDRFICMRAQIVMSYHLIYIQWAKPFLSRAKYRERDVLKEIGEKRGKKSPAIRKPDILKEFFLILNNFFF